MQPVLTQEQHSTFAQILGRAWYSELVANPQCVDFETIASYLADQADTDGGSTARAAIESGANAWTELWELDFWTSSCGHYSFLASCFDDLVLQVLDAAPSLRRADGRTSGPWAR